MSEYSAYHRSVPNGSRRASRSPAVLAALGSLGYVVLAAWGQAVASSEPHAIWYPAAGLGVAVVAWGGSRLVPCVMLAQLVVTIVVVRDAGQLGVTLTVLDAALVGGSYGIVGLLVRADRAARHVRDGRGVLHLLAILAVGSVPAAVIGPALARAGGAMAGGSIDASVAWLGGDLTGMISVVALVLVWSERQRWNSQALRPPAVGELSFEVLLVLGVPIVAVALVDRIDLLYLAVVPVVVIALRRGLLSSLMAVAATDAALATAMRLHREAVSRSDLVALLLTISVTGLLLGVFVSSRHRSSDLNSRLVAALARSDDPIALVASDGRLRWWNRAVARLLGADSDDPPRVADILLGADDRARQLAEHAADGDIWTVDQVLVAADGTETPVSLTIVPEADEEAGGYALVARDMSLHQLLMDELGREALVDDLTGVGNRALLVSHLAHAAERLRRSRGRCALLMLDLDRFRVVNDTLGRAAGDELLVDVARRLSARHRVGDTLARLGGDEFAILIEDLGDVTESESVADNVLQCLRQPFELSTGTVVATGSVSIVRIDPGDAPEEILRRAELAMYRAKSAGGARVTRYDDRMTRSADRRARVESALLHTVELGEVALVHQPVVDLRSGALAFVESSLTLDHPDLGPIDPSEAIAVAGQIGLLGKLVRLLLTSAISTATNWPDHVGVAVTIPTASLTACDVPQLIADAVAGSGLDAGRVIVGLTEEAYLDDVLIATAVLERCRALGVRVALDDFGRSGHSSLHALRSLPIDVLELDPELLTGLGSSPSARAVAGAVLGVAEVLELTVVAAGIDTERQLEVARTLGCQLGRGDRIAPTAPAGQLTAWLGVSNR